MSEHAMLARILEAFAQVSAIPRRSRHEQALRAWLVAQAEARELSTATDAIGNLVIRVPASPGWEAAPIVVLQGHLDMVCEKLPESGHDFDRDPIKLVRDGDWLRASGTTLGADNGIAIAMGLVMAGAPELPHPPLELLFTMDEETGLTGATNLDPRLVEGRILLNLDSEDEGVLTVGCAGGQDTHLSLPLDRGVLLGGESAMGLSLRVGGLSGGHSGVDIHRGRANAIRVLARALSELLEDFDLRLAGMSGGSAHNAIPRDASALLVWQGTELSALQSALGVIAETLRQENRHTDPRLFLRLDRAPVTEVPLTPEATHRVLDLLLALPHGVAVMSKELDGVVETSNNEATVSLHEGLLHVVTSQRSAKMSALRALTRRIEGVARLAGGGVHSEPAYPSWQPDMDSPLLARCQRVYRELYGKEARVEVIHAGLECGIIGSHLPGMDMISFGPTIVAPHSPDERLFLPSVGLVWDYLAALLASFGPAEA